MEVGDERLIGGERSRNGEKSFSYYPQSLAYSERNASEELSLGLPLALLLAGRSRRRGVHGYEDSTEVGGTVSQSAENTCIDCALAALSYVRLSVIVRFRDGIQPDGGACSHWLTPSCAAPERLYVTAGSGASLVCGAREHACVVASHQPFPVEGWIRIRDSYKSSLYDGRPGSGYPPDYGHRGSYLLIGDASGHRAPPCSNSWLP